MLLKSKISKPEYTTTILDRQRLYRRLEGWMDYRALLIQAPAGYGKSTLASRWLDVSGLAQRAAWLSLDEEDGDPRQFIHYLAAALDGCLPGVLSSVQPALQDQKGSPLRALNRLMAFVQEALHPSADEQQSILLVLDDLQRLQSPEVARLIGRLLEAGPRGLHVLLLTRAPDVLPLARLYAQGAILIMDKEDLRFTSAEIEAYLRRIGFSDFGRGEVAQLTERSEGWVSALHLAVLSLGQGHDVRQLLLALEGEQRWLGQYLFDEVLAGQEPQMRRFLLQTSILESFNAALCRAVTHMKDAPARLATIEAADLFLIAQNRREGWFRYHHLFQEMLQRRLPLELEQRAIDDLHFRAGTWLAEAGQVRPAVRQLLAAGAEKEAADLVEQQMRRLIVRDQFAALRLFDLLPQAVWQARPQLALDRAFLAVVLDDPQLEMYVDQAGESLAGQVDGQGKRAEWQGEWHVLQSATHVHGGDLDGAAEGIAHAAACGAVLDDLASGLMWYIDLVIRHLRAAQTDYAASGQRAIDHFERAGFLLGSIAVRRNLARLGMERGDSGAANRLFDSLLDNLPDDRPETTTEVAISYFFAAENRYWQNDLAGARAYTQELLVLANQVADPALICYGQIMGLLYGQDGAAHELAVRPNYDKLRQESAISEFLKVINLEIRRLVAAGRAEDAWQAAHYLGIDQANAAAFIRHPQAILVPYLQAYIARGIDLSAVRSLLEEALAHSGASGRHFHELQLLALSAWQQWRMGEKEAAAETWSQARRLAQETGYVRVLLDIPQLAALPEDMETGANAQWKHLNLTMREEQVLTLLISDLTYQEIAEQMMISINTVRYHVRNIYKKLEVSKRSQAVSTARQLGV